LGSQLFERTIWLDIPVQTADQLGWVAPRVQCIGAEEEGAGDEDDFNKLLSNNPFESALYTTMVLETVAANCKAIFRRGLAHLYGGRDEDQVVANIAYCRFTCTVARQLVGANIACSFI
jgi:hypothetical protein